MGRTSRLEFAGSSKTPGGSGDIFIAHIGRVLKNDCGHWTCPSQGPAAPSAKRREGAAACKKGFCYALEGDRAGASRSRTGTRFEARPRRGSGRRGAPATSGGSAAKPCAGCAMLVFNRPGYKGRVRGARHRRRSRPRSIPLR